MDFLLAVVPVLVGVAVGGAVVLRLVGARLSRMRAAVAEEVERRLAEARAAAPAPAPVAPPVPARAVAVAAMDPAVWVRLDAIESRLGSLEVQVSSLRTGEGPTERPAPVPAPIPPVPIVKGRGPHPSFP